MQFLIKPNWKYVYPEIITPLSKITISPPDLFIELLRYSSKKIGFEPSVDSLNDPKLAREVFIKLPIPATEKICITVLEGYFEVCSSFSSDFAKKYYEYLKEFIEGRNLRYTLSLDCKIRLSVPGLLVSQYSVLKKALVGNVERERCLKELEVSLTRLNDPEGERNLIRVSCNLLEGIAVDKTTNGTDTLGRAIPGCRACFPHESLMDSVQNYYKFLSDYPGLRHGGKRDSGLRKLKKDDAILTLSFTLAISAYLADNDASKAILSGETS